jgi:hypothetical protein
MTEKIDNLIEERKKIQDLLLTNAIERRKLENSLYEVHKEIAKENESEKKVKKNVKIGEREIPHSLGVG